MVWLFGLGKIGKRSLLSNSFISCTQNQDPLFYRELLELYQNESTALFGHPIEHIGNVILHK